MAHEVVKEGAAAPGGFCLERVQSASSANPVEMFAAADAIKRAMLATGVKANVTDSHQGSKRNDFTLCCAHSTRGKRGGGLDRPGSERPSRVPSGAAEVAAAGQEPLQDLGRDFATQMGLAEQRSGEWHTARVGRVRGRGP